MIKYVAILLLSLFLLITSSGLVFAQGEEVFIRGIEVSKRDAIVLSVLFPGLVQMTQGQKVKGISFFVGEAASLILFFNAHENYNTKQKVYERDTEIFNNLKQTPGKTADKDAIPLFNDLKDQNDVLDNLHTIRNTALIVAAGVYAYNIIDAIFFSSSTSESRRAEENSSNKLLVNSAVIDRNPGVMLSKRF